MPKIVRVTAVFLLVMCLFAMVFMELFGLTKYGEETGKHSNFRDYGNALLLLIRVTTGEAWVCPSVATIHLLFSFARYANTQELERDHDGLHSSGTKMRGIGRLSLDRLRISWMGILYVQPFLSHLYPHLSKSIHCGEYISSR